MQYHNGQRVFERIVDEIERNKVRSPSVNKTYAEELALEIQARGNGKWEKIMTALRKLKPRTLEQAQASLPYNPTLIKRAWNNL